MGTASALFYTKQATNMDAEHYANNGNIIFDTIENAGMVQVSHDVIPGQCDRLVTVATSNPKDVVVTLSNSTWNGAAHTAAKGNKVFRHPHLNFYLKVEIHETGASASSYGPMYTAMTVRFIIALEIDENGTLVNPKTFAPRGGANNGWNSFFNTVENTGQGYAIGLGLPLKVSVGQDHFCLGHTKDMQTYETGYLNANASNQVQCGPCSFGYSTCSIAILKGENSSDLYVLVPRNLSNNTSYPNEVSVSLYKELEMGLPRQYRIDSATGNIENLGVAFFSTLQLGVVSDTIGVRVAQVMTTHNNELVRLPLATIHAGAVSDNGIVTVDIDGNGPRQYFAVYGLGASIWHSARFPVEKHPIYLFPWGD